MTVSGDAQRDRPGPSPLAVRRAPGGDDREGYLSVIITRAARDLRNGKLPSLVACDLEDSLTWHVDPDKCSHPRCLTSTRWAGELD